MFFIFQQLLRKYGLTIGCPIVVFIILLYFFLQQQPQKEVGKEELLTISTITQEPPDQVNSQLNEEQPIQNSIVVDVRGAITNPGVYELTLGDRIIDAIDLAGGYTKEADTSGINHAQKLQDEMRIYVPKIGEVLADSLIDGQATVALPSESTTAKDGKININRADETELTKLPGIGPSKAEAIIAYRDENGRFKTIDEIKNISGIGEKTFEKLKDLIVVD